MLNRHVLNRTIYSMKLKKTTLIVVMEDFFCMCLAIFDKKRSQLLLIGYTCIR